MTSQLVYKIFGCKLLRTFIACELNGRKVKKHVTYYSILKQNNTLKKDKNKMEKYCLSQIRHYLECCSNLGHLLQS